MLGVRVVSLKGRQPGIGGRQSFAVTIIGDKTEINLGGFSGLNLRLQASYGKKLQRNTK